MRRRIDNQSAHDRSSMLEIILVVALLGAALGLYGLGDQIIGMVSDMIANFNAV